MSEIKDPREMSRDDFVETFGGIFEHSPWIAETAFDAGLPVEANTAEGLHQAFCTVLAEAAQLEKVTLIKAHPDLAGRLARIGELTTSSKGEQASAGLGELSEAEYQRFNQLNEDYKARFGIPFILAVKGLDKEEILETFKQRLENSAKEEFAEALKQIEKIALLRLKDLLP